jgi:hypothetical protein
VPQHPVDVLQTCVGSKLEASANACLPPPPLVQLVPQSVLIVSDGAFSRFRLPGKARSCAEGFGVFQLARNERTDLTSHSALPPDGDRRKWMRLMLDIDIRPEPYSLVS